MRHKLSVSTVNGRMIEYREPRYEYYFSPEHLLHKKFPVFALRSYSRTESGGLAPNRAMIFRAPHSHGSIVARISSAFMPLAFPPFRPSARKGTSKPAGEGAGMNGAIFNWVPASSCSVLICLASFYCPLLFSSPSFPRSTKRPALGDLRSVFRGVCRFPQLLARETFRSASLFPGPQKRHHPSSKHMWG